MTENLEKEGLLQENLILFSLANTEIYIMTNNFHLPDCDVFKHNM